MAVHRWPLASPAVLVMTVSSDDLLQLHLLIPLPTRLEQCVGHQRQLQSSTHVQANRCLKRQDTEQKTDGGPAQDARRVERVEVAEGKG